MPASPILLLVPYRNKAAVLYSQIPTSASASGDMVVSRAGVSTRVNAQGLIQSVAANVPRLNYPLGGVANGCPALLVEPSGTNLYQQSEDFSNAYWSKVSGVVSGNLTIAPDGNLTADKLIMDNGTSPSIANQSGITRSGTITSSAYRFSVFAKAAEFTVFRVRENQIQGTFLDVNLTNGAITNPDVTQFINPLAENYGNGWYRISWTSPTITSLAKYTIRVGSTGDGVSGIFIWGAQVETGSVATSYIPTTTGTVTRNADIVTNNTFVIPNLIGAILTEFDSPTSGTYFLDNIPIPIASGSNKIAISYTPTTLTIYRNGAQVSGSPVTPPGGTAPVIGNVINIGHNNQLYQLGSGIKSFVLYSSTLSAAEASGLTT